ncbi:MAG: hypothetical protein Q8L87_03905 [Anaerolineales bacterium]|nr:hypothetical protein [Anaerolineales bacterium]
MSGNFTGKNPFSKLAFGVYHRLILSRLSNPGLSEICRDVLPYLAECSLKPPISGGFLEKITAIPKEPNPAMSGIVAKSEG